MATRYNDRKVISLETRGKAFRVWREPFTELRVPLLLHLRRDPFEKAQHNANSYKDWFLPRIVHSSSFRFKDLRHSSWWHWNISLILKQLLHLILPRLKKCWEILKEISKPCIVTSNLDNQQDCSGFFLILYNGKVFLNSFWLPICFWLYSKTGRNHFAWQSVKAGTSSLLEWQKKQTGYFGFCDQNNQRSGFRLHPWSLPYRSPASTITEHSGASNLFIFSWLLRLILSKKTANHPEWQTIEPFKSVLADAMESVMAEGERGLV